MTASDELKALVQKRDRVIGEMSANLLAELIRRTPVDTGQLKASWEMSRAGDTYILSNNMNYASFIFNGIQFVPYNGGTKKIGSDQLPDGVFPIIQKFNRELQKRLDLL